MKRLECSVCPTTGHASRDKGKVCFHWQLCLLHEILRVQFRVCNTGVVICSSSRCASCNECRLCCRQLSKLSPTGCQIAGCEGGPPPMFSCCGGCSQCCFRSFSGSGQGYPLLQFTMVFILAHRLRRQFCNVWHPCVDLSFICKGLVQIHSCSSLSPTGSGTEREAVQAAGTGARRRKPRRSECIVAPLEYSWNTGGIYSLDTPRNTHSFSAPFGPPLIAPSKRSLNMTQKSQPVSSTKSSAPRSHHTNASKAGVFLACQCTTWEPVHSIHHSHRKRDGEYFEGVPLRGELCQANPQCMPGL